jgi:hypothetical protein
MKKMVTLCLAIVLVSAVQAQKKKSADPVKLRVSGNGATERVQLNPDGSIVPPQSTPQIVNLRIPLPNFSTMVYLIRYTQMLDAKTANEIADFLVNQANDSTLNRQLQPVKQK